MNPILKVYGHPASQPSRAVVWACVINKLPIELIVDPGAIADVNPRGQIPAIDDDGFVISEMPAILTYLAIKHRWSDVFPEGLQQRARISQYLHSHHSLTRLVTMKLMAPHVLVAFGGLPTANPLSHINNTCIQESMTDSRGMRAGQELIEQVLDYLERSCLGHHDFIAGTERASIADIACYEEVSQLEQANLFDLSEKKALYRWISRVAALPHHDEVHRFPLALGDIKTEPNTMERFVTASGDAMTSLSNLDEITIA